MEVHFYKYNGKANVIEKTLPTEYTTLNGAMVNEFNVDNPTLKLVEFNFNFNYCYIVELNRYYWIDDITINPNGYYILKMNIDVLYTFKDEILASTIHITNSQPNDIDTSKNKTTQVLFNTQTLESPYDFNNPNIIFIALNTGS